LYYTNSLMKSQCIQKFILPKNHQFKILYTILDQEFLLYRLGTMIYIVFTFNCHKQNNCEEIKRFVDKGSWIHMYSHQNLLKVQVPIEI